VNETPAAASERELIALLRLAYSGELAAAYAYRGPDCLRPPCLPGSA
jgi:hypothetical protein